MWIRNARCEHEVEGAELAERLRCSQPHIRVPLFRNGVRLRVDLDPRQVGFWQQDTQRVKIGADVGPDLEGRSDAACPPKHSRPVGYPTGGLAIRAVDVALGVCVSK